MKVNFFKKLQLTSDFISNGPLKVSHEKINRLLKETKVQTLNYNLEYLLIFFFPLSFALSFSRRRFLNVVSIHFHLFPIISHKRRENVLSIYFIGNREIIYVFLKFIDLRQSEKCIDQKHVKCKKNQKNVHVLTRAT